MKYCLPIKTSSDKRQEETTKKEYKYRDVCIAF